MNKCPKCGNKLSPVDVLCPRCGALVEVIHVASHPDAVSAQNAGVVISRQPRPEDSAQQSNMPISRQARKVVNPAEEIDTPMARQTQDDANLIEEDDLPMSRQARKAALQAKTKQSKRPAADTNLNDSPSKKWLEIEEIDSALIAAESETDHPVISADETAFEDGSFNETAENQMFDSETTEAVPEDDALSDDTLRRYRIRSDDEPVSQPRKKRRSPVALIVLMWVVIAAAVFGAFYFLDNHVASAYGGWDDFVRQITSGKIELDTGASHLSSIDVNISGTQT